MALKCCVQTYAWGRRGSQSTVARLAQNNPEFRLDEEITYAEVDMSQQLNNVNVTRVAESPDTCNEFTNI